MAREDQISLKKTAAFVTNEAIRETGTPGKQLLHFS